MGIIADLSGHREVELPAMKERKFVEIDRDNFGDIMKAIRPHLHVVVNNKLNPANEHLAAELYFEKLDDFRPDQLIKQIPDLDALQKKRLNLRDLATKLDGNDALEEVFTKAMTDEAFRKTFVADLDAAIKALTPAEAAPAAAEKPAKEAAKKEEKKGE